MVASIDGGQKIQPDWTANNRSIRSTETELAGSSPTEGKNSDGVKEQARLRVSSSGRGSSGSRIDRGGRGFRRDQSIRFTDTSPPNNDTKLSSQKESGSISVKSDLSELENLCSTSSQGNSEKSFSNQNGDRDGSDGECDHRAQGSHSTPHKERIKPSYSSVVSAKLSANSNPLKEHKVKTPPEIIKELCISLNITEDLYLRAMHHCNKSFKFLAKKRVRHEIDNIALKLLLKGHIDTKELPSFLWQIFTITQIEQLCQFLEASNFGKLYVKVPPQIRLESTLQFYGILRQLTAPKNADSIIVEQLNQFKDDLISADYDVNGNIIIFSFQNSFLYHKWKNTSIRIRGIETLLKPFDYNLKENTGKGLAARVHHELNYVITLLKVDSGISFLQLKSFFIDTLKLPVIKMEHAVHPIFKTVDKTSWRIEFDQYDCPAFFNKKTLLKFSHQAWYIKHDRMFFNAPCFKCASARHSISRCPQKDIVTVWNDNILEHDFVFSANQPSKAIKKLVRNCSDINELIAFIAAMETVTQIQESKGKKGSNKINDVIVDDNTSNEVILPNAHYRSCMDKVLAQMLILFKDKTLEPERSSAMDIDDDSGHPAGTASEQASSEVEDRSPISVLETKNRSSSPEDQYISTSVETPIESSNQNKQSILNYQTPSAIQISKYETISASMEDKLAPIFQHTLTSTVSSAQNYTEAISIPLTLKRKPSRTEDNPPKSKLSRLINGATEHRYNDFPIASAEISFQLGQNAQAKAHQHEEVAKTASTESFLFNGQVNFDACSFTPEQEEQDFHDRQHSFIDQPDRPSVLAGLGLRVAKVARTGHCLWIAICVALNGTQFKQYPFLTEDEESQVDGLKRRIARAAEDMDDLTVSGFHLPNMDMDLKKHKFLSIADRRLFISQYFNTIINTPTHCHLDKCFWGSLYCVELIVKTLNKEIYIVNFDYGPKLSILSHFAAVSPSEKTILALGVRQTIIPRPQWNSCLVASTPRPLIIQFIDSNHFQTLLPVNINAQLNSESTAAESYKTFSEPPLDLDQSSHIGPEYYDQLSPAVKQLALENLENFNIADVYEHAKENEVSPRTAAKDLEAICAQSAIKQTREQRFLTDFTLSPTESVSDSEFSPESPVSQTTRHKGSLEHAILSPVSKLLKNNQFWAMQPSEAKTASKEIIHDLIGELVHIMKSEPKLLKDKTFYPSIPVKSPNIKYFIQMIFQFPRGVKHLLQKVSRPLLFLRQFTKVAFEALGMSLYCDRIIELLDSIKPLLGNLGHRNFLELWIKAITQESTPKIAFKIACNFEKWSLLKGYHPPVDKFPLQTLKEAFVPILCVIDWCAPNLFHLFDADLKFTHQGAILSAPSIVTICSVYDKSPRIQNIVSHILCHDFSLLRHLLLEMGFPKCMPSLTTENGHTQH